MPTLTPDEIKLREDLAKEYRIDFAGNLHPRHWPECHRKTLSEVKELGNKKYDDYADSHELSEHEPWKAERKSLAMLLVEIAERCRHRNENSWRHACEPIILGRLSSEVCCRKCRGRVWRSEIEVSRDGDTRAATALKLRQETRRPCRCPRELRSNDLLEAVGLNRIFNYRVDEQVNHDPEITRKLAKKERPDRVYGLRQTRNIENLLNDTVKRLKDRATTTEPDQVQEVLGLSPLSQPVSQTGDRQLFPFLVLEAKSGSSGYNWHCIQMQTAFSIRTFLETQNRLRVAAGSQSKWQSGPLVWFFSNKGEDWRLCVAYVEDGPRRPHAVGTTDYRVVDMWRGCILDRDEALQLLLLVDYIFDWARDIYREDIIRELRILASGDNDAASIVYPDTDLNSHHQRDYFERSVGASGEDDEFGSYTAAQASFTELDSPHGVIRHAAFVESRYCCVYVTGDNVRTLLQSTDEKKIQHLCRLILAQMSQSILVSQTTLNKMEEEWTGTSRLPGPSHFLPTEFYTVMTCTTYLTPKFHQVRELFVIAIARDAWSPIVAASGLKKKAFRPGPLLFDTDFVLRAVKRLRAGSPQHLLLTAITRRATRIVEKFGSLGTYLGCQADDGSFRSIVHFVYTSFKRGTLEPQETFLRVSKRFDQQHLLQPEVDPFPSFGTETLHTSSDGCVLILATCATTDSERRGSECCAYLTGGGSQRPPFDSLGPLVKRAFETCDIYHTTRNHRSSRIMKITQGTGADQHLWNIQGTYGVYSRGFEFLRLIRWLKCDDPITQGFPRDPNGNGSRLHKRNLSPWLDREYVYTDSQARMFVLHKLFTREISFWRTVASERRARGVSCCQCCAAIGESDVCSACKEVLQHPNKYDWYKNALQGKEPIEIKPLSGKDLAERLGTMMRDYPTLKEDIQPGPFVEEVDNDGDVDWAKKLDFYGELDKPFEDIGELHRQWRRFNNVCLKNHPFYRFGKRKRSQLSDSEAVEDSSSSGDLSDIYD